MASAEIPEPEGIGSFDAFWEQHLVKVWDAVHKIHKNDFEDAAQHAFFQLWQQWQTLDPDPEQRLKWVKQVARRKALDFWRKERRRRGILEKAAGDRPVDYVGPGVRGGRGLEDMETTAQNLPVTRPAANPEDIVLSEAEAEEALEALLSMVPEGKEGILKVWILRQEDYSHEEIAEMLEISVGHSRNQMTKATRLIDEFREGRGDGAI